MWCDPNITLDLNFLTLVPSLHSLSLCEYPIDGKRLKNLTNQAVGQFNIGALIGASTLLVLKNEVANLSKDFPIVHLSNIDRIFYLISERSMTNKLQNQLLQFVQMIISKWFEQTPKQSLQKILQSLKSELNIFEKALQYVNDQKEQKKELSIKILKLFVGLLDGQKIKGEDYNKKFQDHGLYISKNKKQLFLLSVIYQIEFLLVSNIHKQTELYCPDYFIAYLEKKLFNFTTNRRFSVLIQNMAFLMRKLFIIKMKNDIPASIYSGFLLRIEEIIDRFFSRINLSQKTDFYAFHMRCNSFFDYLQAIFDPEAQNQYKSIARWKEALSLAILEALPQGNREITEDDIQQTIFFLQIRNKPSFLWSQKKKEEINDFPFISAKNILRTITNPQLKKTGAELSSKIVEIIEKGDALSLYSKSNIIQKGIIYYYMHHYQHLFYFSSQADGRKDEIQQKLLNFKRSLSNEQLLELIEYYTIDIELGNFYGISEVSCHQNENSIRTLVYESLIDMLYLRLSNSLNDFKRVETTKEIFHLKTMSKYFVLLIKAICPEFQHPFICKNCKQINENLLCRECEYICLGVKLYSAKNPYNMSRDKYFYQEMFNKLRAKSKEVYYLLSIEMEVRTTEWLFMFSYVLQKLIPR